jgi:hypothetical protein
MYSGVPECYRPQFYRMFPEECQRAYNAERSKKDFKDSWANDPKVLAWRAQEAAEAAAAQAAAAAAAQAAAAAANKRVSLPRVAKTNAKTNAKKSNKGGSKYRRKSKRTRGCKSGRKLF